MNTIAPRWLSKALTRGPRALAPVLLLAFVPKCLGCLLAYLGIATLLGLGPELCGGPAGAPVPWHWFFAVLGAGLLSAALFLAHRRLRPPARACLECGGR